MVFFRRTSSPQPTPDRSSNLPPMLVQQQKTTELLQFALNLDSGTDDWQARCMTVKPLLTGIEFSIDEDSPSGTRTYAAVLPPQQSLDVIQLQKAMATDKGTWLTAVFTVTSGGSGSGRFNYTDEPGPCATEVGYPVDELRAHLEAYPRTDDAMTDWMKEALA